jgi:hypothetical protein
MQSGLRSPGSDRGDLSSEPLSSSLALSNTSSYPVGGVMIEITFVDNKIKRFSKATKYNIVDGWYVLIDDDAKEIRPSPSEQGPRYCRSQRGRVRPVASGPGVAVQLPAKPVEMVSCRTGALIGRPLVRRAIKGVAEICFIWCEHRRLRAAGHRLAM